MTSRSTGRGMAILVATSAVTIVLLSACGIRLRTPVALSSATPQGAVTTSPQNFHGSPTPVTPTATPVPALTPAMTLTPSPLEHIVPRALAGKRMLETSRTVLNSHIDGRNTVGYAMDADLNMERVTTDNLKQSYAIMTGSLTTRAYASLTGSTEPYEILQSGAYRLVGDTYWMVQYASDKSYSCVRLQPPHEMDPFATRQTAFEILLQTTEKFLYGRLSGDEIVNGIPTRHYVIDRAASNLAMSESKDSDVHAIAAALKLTDGDLYLAREGDYVVRATIHFEGKLKEFDFDGRVQLAFNYTHPTAVVEVKPPQACDIAAARANLPRIVGDAELLQFGKIYEYGGTPYVKSSLTLSTKGKSTTGSAMNGKVSIQYTEDRVNQREMIVVEGSLLPGLMGLSAPDRNLPSRAVIYRLDEAAYILLETQNAKDNRCTSIPPSRRDAIMKMFMPDELMRYLMDMGIVYGVYLRDESVNGIKSRHYRIDVSATNAAAEKIKELENKQSKEDSEAYTRDQLLSGDVYTALGSGYIVSLTADFTGAMLDMGLNGQTTARYDLSTPTSGVNIQLPGLCSNAQPS